MEIRAPLDWANKYPILIAGPCSAESEEQVLQTAQALQNTGIDLYRAGIWKPRTRPGSFEGIGKIGLPWLRRVRNELGMPVCTEVAKAQHVDDVLAHQIDVLWVGARTTANPFSVDDLATALSGVDIPILIKNPTNPDYKLWLGAIERFYRAGIRHIAVIHRGFSSYHHAIYRNVPMWQIPLELKRHFPNLKIICDHSHICGRRDLLLSTAQYAMDLLFDGLMTEVHPSPDQAWSDARQQITPKTYQTMIDALVLRADHFNNHPASEAILKIRASIDQLDEQILHLIDTRMDLSEKIGQLKKQENLSIFQPARWDNMIKKAIRLGKEKQLSEQFVRQLLDAIHLESIEHQSKVMNQQSQTTEQKSD